MPDPFGRFATEADIFAALRSPEAEQALIGTILIANRAWSALADLVRPEDFTEAVYGRIWSVFGNIIDSGGTANPITVRDALAEDATLQKAGGIEHLKALVRSVPSLINARDYALTIADRARRRDIITVCQDAIADAATMDFERGAERIIEDHETRLYAIGEKETSTGPVMLRDAVAGALAQAEAAYKRGGGLAGLSTGLSDLDHELGGLSPSDLIVIAGRPGMGKSELALDIAEHLALSGTACIYFSLEMSAEQLAARVIAHRSGISVKQQSSGAVDLVMWPALTRAADELKHAPLIIDDSPGLSFQQIRQRARRAQARNNVELVIVDHLQLMRQPGRFDQRRLEIEIITGGLKALAKDLKLPVILLSQLNRANEGRTDKRPTLADLRESGSIEQDADRVLFIHRPEYYLERERPDQEDAAAFEKWETKMARYKGIAEILIAKNRHGRTGIVTLKWNGALMRFELAYRGQ